MFLGSSAVKQISGKGDTPRRSPRIAVQKRISSPTIPIAEAAALPILNRNSKPSKMVKQPLAACITFFLYSLLLIYLIELLFLEQADDDEGFSKSNTPRRNQTRIFNGSTVTGSANFEATPTSRGGTLHILKSTSEQSKTESLWLYAFIQTVIVLIIILIFVFRLQSCCDQWQRRHRHTQA